MFTIVVNSPVFSAPYFAVIVDAFVGDVVCYFVNNFPHCTFAFEEAPVISQSDDGIIRLSCDPILKTSDCRSSADDSVCNCDDE